MRDSEFTFDVFLCHSAKDKPLVRPIAELLRKHGLRVWFDEWELDSGKISHAAIEAGLEGARVLVLCMSASTFGADWGDLEAQTLRFRDPLNKDRRFVPLRLDQAVIDTSLTHFLYIDWVAEAREHSYPKLLQACRAPTQPLVGGTSLKAPLRPERVFQLATKADVNAYALSADAKRLLTGGDDGLRLWDVESGHYLKDFPKVTDTVYSVSWTANEALVASGSLTDNVVNVWDVGAGNLHAFTAYGPIEKVALSPERGLLLSACSGADNLVLWDVAKQRSLRTLKGHIGSCWSVAWAQDQDRVLSGGGRDDKTVRLWDVETGWCQRVLEGHTAGVVSISWSPDQNRALSGSSDCTARIWDLGTGECVHVLEGHTGSVWALNWSVDGYYALSGASDKAVRVWDTLTGTCLAVLKGHSSPVRFVAWIDGGRVLSGDTSGAISIWDVSTILEGRPISPSETVPAAVEQVHYTNAKVLLVGESSAGKTGLSMRLAQNDWRPSDSTVGAWATQWKLPVSPDNGVEREIWLWDFGGQADQRLIHQLYMDETAVAVLVFDGQKEDLFDTLGQWDRDLNRASRRAFSKVLVAGRVDAGGLRVSRSEVEAFARERGFIGRLHETSAKVGTGCAGLKEAILQAIRWEAIPWRSSPSLFKVLKEEIVRLKDQGCVLVRFNELRETLQLRLSMEFTDRELQAVLTLLAGPGVLWELKFGKWVLLQPEMINAYAQAVIQTMRGDEKERGCLPEERVLSGDLQYQSSIRRLQADEERFILLAMHQTLMERGLCLRETTDKGALLVFPSFYRRERPELTGHPAVLVSYRFTGYLDEIYATLVVRLHHTESFEADELWRYAADFKSLSQQRRLGVKLIRHAEGAGELEVYFDPDIPVEEKMIFSRYVHKHLSNSGIDVVRLRHYVCPHCGRPVRDREVAMELLEENGKLATIICVKCERRVPLWDELEERFAAPEIHQRVLELDKQSQGVLDTESKGRALVGDVISTVALAGQICREKNVSDHGIDMEVEFKDDAQEATGRMVLLQLKSGDSWLHRRKRDGAEIFRIKNERHFRYWKAQLFPVLLVIRNSEGEIRWMDVRAYLRRESGKEGKVVRQVVFEGQRFDVMSVRRWRDEALRADHPR